MKKTLSFLLILFSLTAFSQEKNFKVIGYFMPNMSVKEIPFKYLTHINFSFVIPSKTGDTLELLKNDTSLKSLVLKGKETNIKIFISVGGWGIGDGGGDDTRFHKMAETPKGRGRFIESLMSFVEKYNLDGVDLDWEYPDPDSPSVDQYLELVKSLSQKLHAQNKQLTAAVVSYGKQGGGIKAETFQYFDWLNLMAYDDDYGPDYVKAHSPFSLAVKSLSYWVLERGLPRNKAVLGLPFYSKRGMGNYGPSYKKLLEQGASPFDDYFMGSFYNGKLTIEAKTKLAINEKCAGVMVWEISHDTNDENSLFKVINDTVEKMRD